MDNTPKKDSELVFPHIFRLSASAGSGKTRNLSQRYAQFLLSSRIKARGGAAASGLNGIMAITFTNKAVNEMKERILSLLKSIALGKESELKQIKSVLDLSEEDDGAVENRAAALVDNIIKNYTDFNIKTIDSFLLDILTASLLETDIKPKFEIAANQLSYIDFSIDSLLSSANENEKIRKMFLGFIKNYASIEGKTGFNPRYAVTETVRELRYIENNAGKYFGIAENDDFIEESHKNIENLLNKIARGYSSSLPENLSEYGGLLGDLGNEINKLSGIKLNKTFQKGLYKIAKRDFTSSYWKKKDVKDILAGIKGGGGVETFAGAQSIWDDIRNTVKDIVLSAGRVKLYPYIEILRECRKIMAEKSKNDGVIFIDELKIKVNDLIKNDKVPDIYFNIGEQIYHYLIDEFQDTDRLQWDNLKALIENSISNGGSFFYVGDKKQSIYRFKGGDADLFDDAADGFRNNNILSGGGFYSENLKYNFRSEKLLVDFFNKTFEPGNLIGKLLYKNKNGSFSAVEDAYNKKTAELIYKIYENNAQSVNKEHIKSKGEELRGYIYIERFSADSRYGAESLNEDACYNGDASFTSELPETDGGAYAGTAAGDGAGAEIGGDIKKLALSKAVSIVNELIERNCALGDIAILTRTNKDSTDVVLKLKEEKISVKSEQSADIRNNRLIKETVSFIKFLNNPADNLSFINFISGDIFSSAVQSRLNPELKTEINNFILKSRNEDFIYLKFKKWKPSSLNYTGLDLWEGFISELFNGAGFYPVYDTLCKFYKKFDIYKNFDKGAGFFMRLIELAKDWELKGENGLDMFIDFFEDLRQDAEQFLIERGQTDGVNVLTMHKAKGLQFPVVIIPYSAIKTVPVNKIAAVCVGGEMCLYYTNKNEQEFLYGIDEGIDEVRAYIHEKSMNFIDELNLFYVSLTRAKSEIYIIIPPKIGADKNILSALFFDEKSGACVWESGEKRRNLAGASASGLGGATAINFFGGGSGEKYKNYGWKSRLFGAAKKEDIAQILDGSRRKGLLKGNFLHFILSKIDFLKKDGFISELEKIILNAANIFSSQPPDFKFDAESVMKELLCLLDIDEVKNWFFISEGDKNIINFNEKEIADSSGELKRIDRIVISRKEIAVIDYKTGFPDDAEMLKHKRQVSEYIDLVSGTGIYSGMNISGYILYTDKKEVRKVR